MRTNFTGLPVFSSSSKTRRSIGEITYSPDPVNFATDLVLNETVLFEADAFSATVDSGSLDISVTIGGFLTYNILTSTLGTFAVFFLLSEESERQTFFSICNIAVLQKKDCM